MDGRMEGWKGGWESRVKDCLQQSKNCSNHRDKGKTDFIKITPKNHGAVIIHERFIVIGEGAPWSRGRTFALRPGGPGLTLAYFSSFVKRLRSVETGKKLQKLRK